MLSRTAYMKFSIVTFIFFAIKNIVLYKMIWNFFLCENFFTYIAVNIWHASKKYFNIKSKLHGSQSFFEQNSKSSIAIITSRVPIRKNQFGCAMSNYDETYDETYDEIGVKTASKCLARMTGCWDPEFE